MRKFSVVVLILFLGVANAQVGVGTSTPNSSAQLDVVSTTRGFLPPRMTNAQRIAISTAVDGLQVYQTDAVTGAAAGLYLYEAGAWKNISSGAGVARFVRNTYQAASVTDLVLNQSDVNTISSYVSLNTTTGVITLQPGTYELTGSVGGLYASGSGDCRIYSSFYNKTTSGYLGQGGTSTSGNAGNFNGMPNNAATAVVTVSTATNITLYISYVYATANMSGQADFSGTQMGNAWVTVRRF